MAERWFIPADLEFEVDGISHAGILDARDRAFDRKVKAAWSKAQKRVLADLKRFTAGLKLEAVRLGALERPLQNAVHTWIDSAFGDPAAYGGEIVGECYVQGLMDGEWWNAGSAKEQETRVFVIG
jgi:hypothetical protein